MNESYIYAKHGDTYESLVAEYGKNVMVRCVIVLPEMTLDEIMEQMRGPKRWWQFWRKF